MKKLSNLIILLALLLFCSVCFSQNTTVNGTITDSDSTTWVNAQITLNWVPNPNYPNPNQYTLNGVPLNSPSCIVNTIPCSQYLQQHTFSDNIGVFQFQALDSNQIAPSGSTWQFVIQSWTSAQASVFPNLALTGTTQNVTSFIHTNIKAPRFPASSNQFGGAFGYAEIEISVTPIPGGSFFNVTNGTIEVWACNATICSWQVQAIGSFCSSVSCSFTTSVFSPNINNVCEASRQAGVDFVAQIIACQNQSYMATGGMITAYGYGNTTQTAITILPSLGTSTQPIALLLNQATNFIWNQTLPTANVTAAVASGISSGTGIAQACLVPIATGSSITAIGTYRINQKLGPNAYTYDWFCNAQQDGTQEAFQLYGLGLQGNPAATIKGSAIHDRNTFIGTVIQNVQTTQIGAIVVTTDGGSDQQFINDNFSDSGDNQQINAAVVQINCGARQTWSHGAIQFNNIYNNLLRIGNCGAFNSIGIHFYNQDWEMTPAQIGSFSGHAINVDPIQLTDAGDIVIDGIQLDGSKGTGPVHIIDLLSSGNNGQYRGPVEINNFTFSLNDWNGISAIHNTNGAPYVSAAQSDVYGTQNDASLQISKYRWSGNSSSNSSAIDYLDSQNVGNQTTYNAINTPRVYSSLPNCIAGIEGQIAAVTDSSTATPGRVITGGGTNHVQAYCNGFTWAVAAGAPPGGTTTLSQAFTICASGCTYNTTICTTTGLALSSGGCTVGTFSWPLAFADTSYAAYCGVTGNSTGGSGPIGYLVTFGGKTTTGISIGLQSVTATAISVTEIDCLGVHN